MFTLRFLERGVERTHQLRGRQTLIGRAPTCHLVINDATISRQHASVRIADGRCFLSDAGSRNGTSMNGRPVVGEQPLMPGDTFEIGQVTVTLEQVVTESELLSEHHEILDDGATILRRVDEFGSTHAGVLTPAIAERRSGSDRRRADRGRPDGDRRSGRDRRGGRLLRLLSEIGKTLVNLQPLPSVLARVVDLVLDVVPAERAFLLLRSSPDDALTARALRNRDGSTPEHVTLSRTIVNRVMNDRVAMLASDVRHDSRLDTSASIHALNVRSFMCAPLWNRNVVLGVLYVDSSRTRKFRPDDLEIFTALSNYAAVAIEQARLADELMQEIKRRERLQRYHSPALVNRIVQAGSDDTLLKPQTRDVTVMFCDIVGFTTLSERMDPEAVAGLLDAHLGEMTEIIFSFDGTLDKFMGDGIMSVFGAPFDQPDHADRCVQAALAMRERLEALSAEQPVPLCMRFGICSGLALTGDIGSSRRREFAVIGDVVNTASRLEADFARPNQIVIARSTHERLRSPVRTRCLGTCSLRGRISDVEVFEVIG